MQTKIVHVAYGQDTPAYTAIQLAVPADATNEQIVDLAKAKAMADAENMTFEPDFDWLGLRIVAIRDDSQSGLVATDVPIVASADDLGRAAQLALNGRGDFHRGVSSEAARQGFKVQPKVAVALGLADAYIEHATSMPEIGDFAPFKLVVEANACSEDGESPDYAEVEVTPALLRQIAKAAATCMAADIRVAHLDGDDGVWPDSDLNMRGTDLVVMHRPGPSANFWWSGHPKHSDYDCETRALDLRQILACVTTGPKAQSTLPDGFAWVNEVLFYAPSCYDGTDYLVETYLEAQAENA